MMKARKYIRSARGFTIIETMIAVTISATILIGIYMMVNEGISITAENFDAQGFDRSLNNIQLRFGTDIRGAEYFYAGVESAPNPDDGMVLDDTPLLTEITFTNRRNDGTLAWIKYELYIGPLTEDRYLIRMSDYEDPSNVGLTYVADDIVDFDFLYYDDDGLITNSLEATVAVGVSVVLDSPRGSEQREFYFRLRSQNKGLLNPPWDFNDEREADVVK